MVTIGRMEWRAPSVARTATPSLSDISLAWLVQASLFLCFLSAVVQYELTSGIWLYVPLMFLAVSALLVLCGRHRGERVQHIFSGGGLWFAGMLFGEVVSYTSHDTYSILYGLAFLGVFLCARLVLQEIGVGRVVRAYSQAGIIVCCLILFSGKRALFAGQGVRFTGGTRMHPNLAGFVLAGFFPVVVWRAIEETRPRWKWAYLLLSVVTFLLIFLTGSRGSLSAVLIAGVALMVAGLGRGWHKRIRVTHMLIMAVLFLLPLATAYLLANHRLEHVGSYISEYLALKTTQRGIGSGLSGRTGFWKLALHMLAKEKRWFYGFGYRAGDRLVGVIDNGYVQLLFESGLIAGGLIFGSMVRVFILLWRASGRPENNAWTRFYMMLWCLMIVYFLNNISTRYLFSFGSPFSLCVLFLMAASRRELVGGGEKIRVKAFPVARPAPAASWSPSEG